MTPFFEFLEWLSKRKKINQDRIDMYQKACQKYKNAKTFEKLEVARKHTFYVEKVKMMTCTINKAGSTTYNGIFQSLRKKLDKKRFC